MKVLHPDFPSQVRHVLNERWLTGDPCPHFSDRQRHPLHFINLSTANWKNSGHNIRVRYIRINCIL